jgi:hypothetical protein
VLSTSRFLLLSSLKSSRVGKHNERAEEPVCLQEIRAINPTLASSIVKCQLPADNRPTSRMAGSISYKPFTIFSARSVEPFDLKLRLFRLDQKLKIFQNTDKSFLRSPQTRFGRLQRNLPNLVIPEYFYRGSRF